MQDLMMNHLKMWQS